MYFFLLFICTSISSLCGQDFLSSLPTGILQVDILPKLVIPQAPNQDTLTYIADLIGYIEQTEYPELSKRPDLDNERLIKKSQLANAPLISLACVNKALNQHITAYKKLLKKHITEMIPQDCTLKEVLSAYPFIKNNTSYTIFLPDDQVDSPWNRICSWRIAPIRDIFSTTSLVFSTNDTNYTIKIETITNNCDDWKSHTEFTDNLFSEKTITEQYTLIINFLDKSIELLKKNNSFFYEEKEELVNSLRMFLYIFNSHKAIKEVDGGITYDVQKPGFKIWLKLKKLNKKNNQPVMSPTDIYELYKAMLGLF